MKILKTAIKIAIIHFAVLFLFVQSIYGKDESAGYRWKIPDYDTRTTPYIEYDETRLSNYLFPDFAAISNLSNWKLNGPVKTIFVLYLPEKSAFELNVNEKVKSEVLIACKKLEIDSSNAFFYTYSPDGRIIEKLEIHFYNRFFSENESEYKGENNKIVINGLTFTGYSSVDTVRTFYEYNKSNLIEKIHNEGEFELRKYDENNRLISREGGFTLDSYNIKNTFYKTEYKYSPSKIEVYTTSLLDIYPTKTKDIFLDSNLNKTKIINYNEFNRDTSSIVFLKYDNKSRIKTITENVLDVINGKLMINYKSAYKTEYTYNSIGKLIEEISYTDTFPDIKFEYKYDNVGLLTNKVQYSYYNEFNRNWNSDIANNYYYLSMDKMNNPTQIVDISSVMQFDKSFNYRMDEMHFVTYEYYK